jgi:hypothetical protein
VRDLTQVNGVNAEKERMDFCTRSVENLRRATDHVARRYNATTRETPFKVGDTVVYKLKVLSSKTKGVSAKLGIKWSKPMVIAKFLKHNVVQLANLDSGVVIRNAHISQLKGYHVSWALEEDNRKFT